MAVLSKFFGRAGSDAVGVAIGSTAAPALLPIAQLLINEAWQQYPDRPLALVNLAMGVAQGQIDRQWATDEARTTGFSKDRFDRLVHVYDNGPGQSAAFELWRRGVINEDGFRRALKRAALEPEWIDALVAIHNVLLSPADLAMARQQGFVDQARQYDESAKQGVTNERAEILFEMAGLPPGIETALDMWRRGIIGGAEFAQIVREGHTKIKYTDELAQMRRVLLTAALAVRAHLKGWIDQGEMHQRGAVHGYTAEDMDLWYLAEGRPAAPGQMATAAVRGIDGPDGRPMDREQFLKGIRESDIRPEWGPMLWESRFLYPSLFQLTRLVSSGAIDVATGTEWAHKARYAPEVVAALRKAWTQTAGPTGSNYPDKADTQLWTRTHTSYVANEIDDAAATQRLQLLGIPVAEQTEILNRWRAERSLIRRQLTPAQIKKAYKGAVTNPATNAPWTRADAVARLEELGYDTEDVETFLDE